MESNQGKQIRGEDKRCLAFLEFLIHKGISAQINHSTRSRIQSAVVKLSLNIMKIFIRFIQTQTTFFSQFLLTALYPKAQCRIVSSTAKINFHFCEEAELLKEDKDNIKRILQKIQGRTSMHYGITWNIDVLVPCCPLEG